MDHLLIAYDILAILIGFAALFNAVSWALKTGQNDLGNISIIYGLFTLMMVLLGEAGYPNGFEVRHVNSHQRIPGQKQFIEALQQDLAKVGIRMKIQEYTDEGPLATLIREGKAGPMYQMSWGYYSVFDCDSIFYDQLTHYSKWSYWWSDETTKMIEEARNSMDPEFRKKIYSRLQHVIKEEAPFLYMWQYVMVWGLSSKIDMKIPSEEFPRFFDARFKK